MISSYLFCVFFLFFWRVLLRYISTMQRYIKKVLLVCMVLCWCFGYLDAMKGRCPPTEGQIGICVELCGKDNRCPKGQICCSNGCGHTCRSPVPISRVSKRGTAGICVELCSGNADCPSDKPFCRSNGCGHVCRAWKLRISFALKVTVLALPVLWAAYISKYMQRYFCRSY